MQCARAALGKSTAKVVKDETFLYLCKNGRLPFGIFETGTNGTVISWEQLQKIQKFLNFRKANHSTENSGNSGMKAKWKGNFQERNFENLGIPHEVVLFIRIDGNSQFSTQR